MHPDVEWLIAFLAARPDVFEDYKRFRDWGRQANFQPPGPSDQNAQPGQRFDGGSEDMAWNAAHPFGYGLTENPSPWGYNRDVYNAEHPGGPPQGYYNPQTGFYDSPSELPFQAAGPGGPEMIGTGGQDQSPAMQEALAAIAAAGGLGEDGSNDYQAWGQGQ